MALRKAIGKVNCYREYTSWRSMKLRCLNKNAPAYSRYGGIGIKICKQWINSFETFYKDMGPRPIGKSLERINNKKGYYPNNCKWATRKEQQNNTRTNRFITYKGETLTITQWENKLNFATDRLYIRLKLGWPIEKALTQPIRKRV